MREHLRFWIVARVALAEVDVTFNVFAALSFSGALDGAISEYKKKEQIEVLRLEKRRLASGAFALSENHQWQSQVEEMAGRGFTLRSLLQFYKRLGIDCMD